MLERIGVKSLDDLFGCIPPELRFEGTLDLPPALSEIELTRHLEELAGKNRNCSAAVSFLGGGCYDHFIPAVVDAIASRSEFYTAYTPYQAEASQGTLQAAFEYQTLVCQLTGMEAANASLYDGATAIVEAALLAQAATGRHGRVVVCETVHPEYRRALATYFRNLPAHLHTIPQRSGRTTVESVQTALDDTTACLVMQSPNIFGQIEPVAEAAAAARGCGALFVQSFDPISLGMLRRPGDYGADVAVAEGQALGSPMSFGGPFLGLFACREQFIRKMPGRIVGQTVDRLGNRAFVLTLQTREQHIRREKATSNICTNQGLIALRASVYLALLGPQGLKETAELCFHKAHYAADRLAEVPGVRLKFPGPFFKEFVIELPRPADGYLPGLLAAGFHGGVPLGKWYPELERCLLVAVTEKRTKAEIDRFVAALWKLLATR
jgi:glycine dehydrogenase subunit 1